MEEVTKFICSVRLEEDILNGIVSVDMADELLIQCTNGTQARMADPRNRYVHQEMIPEMLVNVFPNPAGESVSVRTSVSDGILTLSDIFGRMVIHETFHFDSDIDLSGISNGIYTLKIENVIDKKIKISKLIINN